MRPQSLPRAAAALLLALLAAAAAGTSANPAIGAPATSPTTATQAAPATSPTAATQAAPATPATTPPGAASATPPPTLTPEAYARLLRSAARGQELPPPVVTVQTPGGPTTIDHRPLLPGSPHPATPATWQEMEAAAQAPPATLRGGPADRARLQAILGPGQAAERLMERIGQWIMQRLLGWLLKDRTITPPPWLEPLLGWAAVLLFGLAPWGWDSSCSGRADTCGPETPAAGSRCRYRSSPAPGALPATCRPPGRLPPPAISTWPWAICTLRYC